MRRPGYAQPAPFLTQLEIAVIEIANLSPRQYVFADILWACQGRDQVDTFIQSLPKKYQGEALAVLNMMVAAVFDNDNSTEMAEQALAHLRK